MTATAAIPTSADLAGELQRIALTDLHESPWNPRKHFDPAKLAETADSLRANGQLTPIVVRPRPGGGFEIGAGHRRVRAAGIVGFRWLMAVVRPLNDVAFLELLTIENKQREDVTPLDEAAGFKLLMEKAAYDVPKLAARVGLSVKYVYDRLKLLQLVPTARKLLEDGTITAGHAIILARLSPTDQKRAIGDIEDVLDSGEYSAHRASLLLRADHGASGELPLHDQVKPVTVREFQQAVQEKIRATPERVDPFLFPESVKALEAAKEEKLSVIHITREYRVDDAARDEKTKTFGSPAWKRADGAVEEEWGGGRKIKSKTCAFSRYGFVAAGPGQGEVFRVCINKEKCKIHWPEQFAAAEARKKKQAKRAKAAPAQDGAPEVMQPSVPEDPPTEFYEQELEDRENAILQQIAAIAKGLKDDALVWNLTQGHGLDYLFEDGWYETGKRKSIGHVVVNNGGLLDQYHFRRHFGSLLPGKHGGYPKDLIGARAAIALEIFIARDAAAHAESIEQAVETRWKAHLKEEAAKAKATAKGKPPAKKKPKAKGR